VIVCVDFDGTIVERDRMPFRFLPGAVDGLRALKRAGHVLVLYSARANRAVRYNPELDPLVRAGIRPVPSDEEWPNVAAAHEALYRQMCRFVAVALPGLFDAIDDGEAGKPICDVLIDDRSINPVSAGGPFSSGWAMVARTYGEPPR
jgi:hypothetical protein